MWCNVPFDCVCLYSKYISSLVFVSWRSKFGNDRIWLHICSVSQMWFKFIICSTLLASVFMFPKQMSSLFLIYWQSKAWKGCIWLRLSLFPKFRKFGVNLLSAWLRLELSSKANVVFMLHVTVSMRSQSKAGINRLIWIVCSCPILQMQWQYTKFARLWLVYFKIK